MNYQTDFTGYIRNGGCLDFCLTKIGEKKAGKGLTHLQKANLINKLNREIKCSWDRNRPVLSDEVAVSLPGIFVWDHEAVANHTLLALGVTSWKLKYIGRIYMPWEEARGKISFGTHENADEVILQVQTINGGHFEMSGYNPWKPGTQMIDIKSLRYYRWV